MNHNESAGTAQRLRLVAERFLQQQPVGLRCRSLSQQTHFLRCHDPAERSASFDNGGGNLKTSERCRWNPNVQVARSGREERDENFELRFMPDKKRRHEDELIEMFNNPACVG